MQVKCTLLHENARTPKRGHGIDVGLDCFTPEAGVLKPGPNKIPLGFAIEVPVGYNASMYPRSGMASGEKTVDLELDGRSIYGAGQQFVKDHYPEGVAILAQLPPIDPGYTGEVHAIVINMSNLFIKYPQHTRFGQLVFHPIAYADLQTELDITRGSNGFGSSGIA